MDIDPMDRGVTLYAPYSTTNCKVLRAVHTTRGYELTGSNV